MVQGEGGRAQKKSPAFVLKTGDFTRMHPSQSYPRRPFREEYPGRSSDSRIFLLLAPSHPSTAQGSGCLQVSSPTTAAGPSPTSPQEWGHGVPFTRILPFVSFLLTKSETTCQAFGMRQETLPPGDCDIIPSCLERVLIFATQSPAGRGLRGGGPYFLDPFSLNRSSPSPTLIR